MSLEPTGEALGAEVLRIWRGNGTSSGRLFVAVVVPMSEVMMAWLTTSATPNGIGVSTTTLNAIVLVAPGGMVPTGSPPVGESVSSGDAENGVVLSVWGTASSVVEDAT